MKKIVLRQISDNSDKKEVFWNSQEVFTNALYDIGFWFIVTADQF